MLVATLLAQRKPRSSLIQRNCETPMRWVGEGPYAWAWKTGMVLGSGFLTRIGFRTFYLMILAVLATRSVASGVIVWVAYAVMRALTSVGVPLLSDSSGARVLVKRQALAYRLDFVFAAVGSSAVLVWTMFLIG